MMHEKKPQDNSELLKRALAAIDQLQAKLAQVEMAKHEPIAIIGIGCRFPGADGADAFWRNLIEGVDSVTEVPSWRWDVKDVFDPDPDAIGKAYTKWGGFLKDLELFDAPFFGITPREAAYLDPQQRQVLESSWLALEDAGLAASVIANTRTGVYLGLSAMDYSLMVAHTHGIRADSFALSGTAHSIAGGRVSYFLGAQGPNISVDTACSSSLVAVHLAVKGLRAREADMALAGGVNITLLPDASIITSRARMMSPTGRCNAFDESADGYVRSEGSAMIVLKRLSDAQRDGNRILALIRGTALNQDGRSSGLTAPHGPSQEAVVRAALEDAGLTAGEIAFVEAHGTGTSLGDPIEVTALGNVFAGRPADRPLLIGSVKANIGHTEAAAGMAGLIKAVQALRRRVLPRQLHVNVLNPMINWDAIPVRVALETTSLAPRSDEPLCCGVSSFGFSGTNAHAILQEAPPAAAMDALPHAADASTMLAISARTHEALGELAGRYADLFEATDAPTLREVAAAVPLARSHFAERAGIVAADVAEASTALRAIASGAKAVNVVSGRVRSASTPEVVFLFTGQGAQYVGMGKGMYETEQVFRDALDLCDQLARPHLAHGLIDVIFGRNGTEELLDDTTYTQPALFALEYALAQTWRSWGVEPVAVMGHSVGEYTAACIAGMVSLEDAIRLIIARGRLMGSLPAGGAMAAVFAPEDVVRTAIAETGGRVSIAAVNGPTNIVMSGAAEDLETIAARLEAKGIELQRLNVSHAFHSALMDPILDEFEEVAAGVRFDAPKITLHSNLTGARMSGDGRCAEYWRRHLREAVRFSDSIAALQRDGYRQFLEIGPAPILTGMAQRSVAVEDAVYLPSLRRGRDDRRSMLETAAHLYTAGAHLNWPALLGPRRLHVSLPTYPFQRTRHWIEGSPSTTTASFAGKPSSHAMLGVKAAAPVDIYQTRLGAAVQPWTKDHRIFGFIPFPAAGFLELALAAARECDGPEATLEDVTISEGLLLPETGAVEAQVVLAPDANGRRSVQIYSAAPDVEDAAWRLHMSALIDTRGAPQSSSLPMDTQGFRAISCEAYYERIGGLGAEYGPLFRGMQTMRRNGRELFAEVALPTGLAAGHILHPALLDACLHPLGICMEAEGAEGTSTDLFMPVGVRRFAVYRDGVTAGVARVTGAPLAAGAQSAVADIALFDEGGAVIAEVIGLEVRRATRTALDRMMRRSGPQADWRFGIDWRPSVSDDAPLDLADQNWLVFRDSNGVAEDFATRMRAVGASVELIAYPAVLDEKHIVSMVAKAAPIYRPLHGVALLWPLDAPASFDDANALDTAACAANASALVALRAVADRTARLLVVTRGTQQIDIETGADLVQSSIWSFAGVVAAEHPSCGLTRIDLSVSASRDEDADALCAEAAATDMEDRVAYRAGQRYAARLSLAGAPTEQVPVVLDIRKRGSLEQLMFTPLERCAPGPGEIELRVLATGLNFRDVLNVLGAYPGDPGPLGNECAGVVTAVGPGVTRFVVGDDVVAMVDRSFATYCVAPESMCASKPAHLTYQEAATVPVTFLTADHALRALAKIKGGDRVLVHAVTGGVGMAAAQIALRAGAIVYGTAGTSTKRALARRLGVHFTSDSRSLAFVDDVLRDSNGEGVDIVLNSLAGEFIPASLGLLRKGGAFIEIGKTEIWDAGRVAERYPGIEYHALYLGDVAAADPAMIRERLESILADMGDGGTLKPLPQTVFSFEGAERAFRYVAQGRHTGKVVLTQRRGAEIRHDGTYVLTGGLTGLGLTTARWLAAQGAGGVLLLGRRAPSEEARAVIAEMEALGARVLTAQANVGDTDALSFVLDDARRKLGPIRGVIHAAGVLDDGMLSEQTPERFARVMAPKVRGGWALHELTLQDPLDFFILFSSGAALLGSPGQSNYAAANGFLDGLAHYRQARGLPALAINWGSWAEVGMAAGVGTDHHRRWSAMGLEMITPISGMEMLGEMIRSGAGPQVAAVPLVRARLPASVSPFYRELVNRQDAQVDSAPPINIISDLLAAEPSERQSILDGFLADQVQRALALPASQGVDRHESLLNLGMDSLMAMELRNRLLSATGVRVAVADLLDGATVTDVGRMLMRDLAIEEPKPAPVMVDAEWEEGRL
jgi:acyl transferase domain-containing protein/NAD(P)-dependent dehydrogenase (short-subunit alcohol dehydrogenase family)